MNLQEITSALDKLNNWVIDGGAITKQLEFDNFSDSLNFVNKLKDIAEKNNHYPSITIRNNLVRLHLMTFNTGELTQKDFEVAKEIDKLK